MGREVRRRDGEAWPEQRTAARLGYSAACEEGERERENGHGSWGDKDDARAWQARFADVRRVATPTSIAGGELSKNRGVTVDRN